MIGELRDRLPEELVWNVLKYTRHPVAEILKPIFEEHEEYRVKCHRGGSIIWNLQFTPFYAVKTYRRCITCDRRIYKPRRLFCLSCDSDSD